MQSISLIRATISVIILYILADLSFGYFLETKTLLETLIQTIASIVTHGAP